METVIEISSGEEDDLLIMQPKKVKLEREENVNFTREDVKMSKECEEDVKGIVVRRLIRKTPC